MTGTPTPVDEFVQRCPAGQRLGLSVTKDEIEKVFNFFDENKDGLISKDDLRHFMEKLGFETTDEEINSMVKSVDINGDGSVDFLEFANLYEALVTEEVMTGKELYEEEDLQDAFNVFDADHDGFITPVELQTVLIKLGMKEGASLDSCIKMIENVDDDRNGQVDFKEFKKLMTADFARG
ncbi:hypothetical protein R1flu_017604 [Riccia fluitans]|uniref:EF-hand domain-containing protein n=1 Tax=Riccia fluitans TaxID=41844 RepID=A0ABD1ZFT5_9MARC